MRIFLVILILYGTFSVWAQVHSFLSVDFQNDFLDCKGHGTDRYYTAGNFLTFTRVHSTKKQVISFSLIQQAFTPSDLQDTIVSNFDYPYAGLLFLEGSYGWESLDSSLYIETRAALGQTGKYSGVAGLQRTLHRIFRDEMPKGWSSMVEQGAVVQASIEVHKAIVLKDRMRLSIKQLWNWGTAYKNVKMGIYGSIGYVPPFSLRSLVTPASLYKRPVSDRFIDRISFYVAPEITWVFSNSILEKGFDSLVKEAMMTPSVGFIRTKVVSIEGGLAYYGPVISILYRQNWQTPELFGSSSHHYGAIAILYKISYKNK